MVMLPLEWFFLLSFGSGVAVGGLVAAIMYIGGK